jgi:hypothetical protein
MKIEKQRSDKFVDQFLEELFKQSADPLIVQITKQFSVPLWRQIIWCFHLLDKKLENEN